MKKTSQTKLALTTETTRRLTDVEIGQLAQIRGASGRLCAVTTTTRLTTTKPACTTA